MGLVVGALLACGPKGAEDTAGTGATSSSTTGGSTTGGPTTGTTVVELTTTDSTAGGPAPCGSLLANNDENCVCLVGFERCNPDDPLDTDCCMIPGGGGECPDPNSYYEQGQCFCNPGYWWCDPDDPDDLSCCADDPGQTTTGTTGPSGCPEEQLPPAGCDEDVESFFCTHPEACGPEGSGLYVCEAGQWVPAPQLGEQSCQLDGYDFSYGCIDTGTVEILCGIGPGSTCDEGAPSLCEMGALYSCVWGKRTVTDCLALCTEGDGMGGPTFDHGYCDFADDGYACICCDMGDPGCPI